MHTCTRLRARRLTALYRTLLCGASGPVLDLCASWASHLPPELRPPAVVGVGLNEAELRCNPRLDRHLTLDLNAAAAAAAAADRLLPFEDGAFGAVVMNAGVQYLAHPERVLAEALRVLAPGGGVAVLSWGDHAFADKATRGFAGRDPAGRVALVAGLLRRRRANRGGAGGWGGDR
jgi:SAM-dependent methyltransferase